MEHKVIVDGISFVASNRKYLYNAQKRLYLHRYLWEKNVGKIPTGYEIHHKDKNPLNNELDNLEMLSIEEHRKLHSEQLTNEQREKRRINMVTTVHEAAKKWHGSCKGKEWHKKHYEETKNVLHVRKDFMCLCCNKSFRAQDTKQNKFCSNKCKSKYRRLSGIDNENRKCAYCGTDFSTNKYSKTKTCSRTCANRYRAKDSPNLHE